MTPRTSNVLVVALAMLPACTILFPRGGDDDGAADAAAALDASDAASDAGATLRVPEILFPWNGYRTRNRRGETVVRLVWVDDPAGSWDVRWAVCAGPPFSDCLQDAEPERTTEPSFEIKAEETTAPPVGARYVWQVRARTDEAKSAWSTRRYFDVRTEGDYDGDGSPDPAVGAPEHDDRDPILTGDAGWAVVVNGSALPDQLEAVRVDNPATGQHSGYAVASAGDLNADGFADLAIGAPSSSVAPTENLAVVLWGGVPRDSLFIGNQRLTADHAPIELGTAVAGAGDFDGDGFDDLAVGAPGAAGGAGEVHLFRGRAEKTLAPSPDEILSSPNAAPDGRFGAGLARAGDIDADGFQDLLVAAPGEDAGPGSLGRAYVCRGPRDGAGPSCRELPATGDVVRGVAGVGDVDGDLAADGVILGAQGFFLVRGGAGGPVEAEPFTADGIVAVAAAGDLDGDGYADVAVGFEDALPQVFWGGAAPDTFSDATEVGQADDSPGGGFGAAIAGVGDLDADGFDDLAVGAPRVQVDINLEAGKVYVFGFADRTQANILEFVSDGPEVGAHLGASVAVYEP